MIDSEALRRARDAGELVFKFDIDELAGEVLRLRGGEALEPKADEARMHTPAEFLRFLNDLDPARRLEVASQILDNADTSARCFRQNHAGALEELEDYRRAFMDAQLNARRLETGSFE